MIYFDQGTEHWVPEAKRFLAKLQRIQRQTNAPSISRATSPESGVIIWAKVTPQGSRVHITGGVQPVWVPHRPEQNLWAIPSAVLPSMGSVIPWTPVIQHVVYPYLTSDPLTYTVKHQLVICRYCRRVAEYEWTETRSVETTAGEQLLSGTIDLTYDDVVENADVVDFSGISDDGLTWYFDGVLYTEEGAATAFNATTAVFAITGAYIFTADGNDYNEGTVTFSYDPVTLTVPMSADPIEDGFSLDGTTWGYAVAFGGGQFTEAEFASDNGAATATFNATGPEVTAGSVTGPVYSGAYVSHDNTNVTIRAVDVYGAVTNTVVAHGLIATSAANPWGYLTDDLGLRNWSATQSPEYTYNVLRGATVLSTVTIPGSVNAVVYPDGTYGPPNGFDDIENTVTGYWHGSPGFYVNPGVYWQYNGIDELSAALTAVPEPPLADAQAQAAAYNQAWDDANYLRWKEIMDTIQEEMDAKRFGATMDVAELCSPSTYPPHRQLRVFPVVSSATFTWADAYGNGGTYSFASSYMGYANLTPILGITLTPPATLGGWTFTVGNPYQLTWDGVSAFALSSTQTPFNPPFDYMGAGPTPLEGSGKYEYFGLYKAPIGAAPSFSTMTAVVS